MKAHTEHERVTFPEDWNAGIPPGPPFVFDAMHRPFPHSPLFCSSAGPAFSQGFTAGHRDIGEPVEAVDVIIRNHYWYMRIVWGDPDDEEAIDEALREEAGRLAARWHGEHLPAIVRHLDHLRALDCTAVPIRDLASVKDEAEAIHRDLFAIHFRITPPMLVAMQQFDDLWVDLFGGEYGDGHVLVAGSLSESVKSAIGLGDLANAARERGLAETFLTSEPADLPGILPTTDDGREFLSHLDHWLATYGYRQDLFEYTTPTWIERPAIPLATIRNYLRTGYDARAEHEAVATAAHEALVSAREQLASYPEAVRQQFEDLLGIARFGAFIQEEHNFYIDQAGVACLRLFYLRYGRRLVADGLLDAADDIFMLEVADLDRISAEPQQPGLADELRQIVATRRVEMEEAAALTPPPFIGTPPFGPRWKQHLAARARSRFWGGPVAPSGDPGVLAGTAASRGTVTGVARVARTLEEAVELQPGEILVTITTMPSWSPLFGVAAGVVTETGGQLSHCAIVAREYGIPAVVGVAGATTRIVTGESITVDGTAGQVLLHA